MTTYETQSVNLFLARFGWTGFTSQIHWAAPAAAGIFIGFGVLCIFLPCFNYIVDSYLPM
jgi:DHA1 family multidrug resistance protein-like MFS transporter